MIPLKLQDRLLLGMELVEYMYVDKALPFGLKLVPIIFMGVMPNCKEVRLNSVLSCLSLVRPQTCIVVVLM